MKNYRTGLKLETLRPSRQRGRNKQMQLVGVGRTWRVQLGAHERVDHRRGNLRLRLALVAHAELGEDGDRAITQLLRGGWW